MQERAEGFEKQNHVDWSIKGAGGKNEIANHISATKRELNKTEPKSEGVPVKLGVYGAQFDYELDQDLASAID